MAPSRNATARTGRPHGSTDGLMPPGGFPAVSPELGPFLAGFIEGEGCFLISRQRRGPYGCAMRLSIRDDDHELLSDISDKTRLGRLRSMGARRTSPPQLLWTIST